MDAVVAPICDLDSHPYSIPLTDWVAKCAVAALLDQLKHLESLPGLSSSFVWSKRTP